METMISQLTVIILVVVMLCGIYLVFGGGNGRRKRKTNENHSSMEYSESENKTEYIRKGEEDYYTSSNNEPKKTVIRRGYHAKQNTIVRIEQLEKNTNKIVKRYEVSLENEEFLIEKQGHNIKKTSLTIGRNKNADINVLDQTRYVGNYHAKLLLTDGDIYIEDCSKNGTFDIDGNRIKRKKLGNRDIVLLDESVMLYFTISKADETLIYGKNQEATQMRRW